MAGSRIAKKIKIDPAILDDFESIAGNTPRHRALEWRAEHDHLIENVFPRCKVGEFTAKFKKKYGFGCEHTIKRRYKELTA